MHKGGSSIYGEIVKLVAPLGLNAFGASLVVLFLNHVTTKHKNKKSQKGGYIGELAQLIAPLGADAFLSTGVLLLLAKIYDRKSYGSKSGVKQSMTQLRKSLKEKLKKFK